jgi:hypothetical protein
MNQKQKVLETLLNGEQLTAKQISSRFNVGNPYEVVRQIRRSGYAVYANQRTNSKGETKTFYRVGAPTRAMIATAYSVMGAV